MKRVLFAISLCLAALCGISARAQISPSSPVQLDQYGGRMDIPCTNATGHVILVKMNNRWWFCTAAGHALIGFGISNVLQNGNINDCAGNNAFPQYAAKYGTGGLGSGNWQWSTLKRMTLWGFNATGTDSGIANPDTGTQTGNGWPNNLVPINLLHQPEIKPDQNVSTNRSGNAPQPVHDMIKGADKSIYTAFSGGALFDFFAPYISMEFTADLNNSTNADIRRPTSPWILMVLTGDSDWLTGSGASPDFAGTGLNPATSALSPDPAFIAIITSPFVSFIPEVQTAATPTNNFYVTPDGLTYSKAQALNPVTTCSIANPCSLRDYLWQKYGGSIAALNSAWGGATYTTFDSSGTNVTAENVSTPASYTFAHGNVTPSSIYAVLTPSGGSPVEVAGDVAQFLPTGTGTVGTGQVRSPMGWTASQGYCGSGTSTCNPSNLQGAIIVDSNGNIEEDVTAGTATSSSGTHPTWCTTGFGSCTTTDGGVTWLLIGPSITGSITYSTGAALFTIGGSGSLPAGETLSVNYGFCGWHTSCGTGLMDEWGNSSWLGNPLISQKCLTGPTPGYAKFSACVTGGSVGAPVVSATIGNDLDGWISQLIAGDYKPLKADLRAVSDALFAGSDFLGSGQAPPRTQILQGAAGYVDLIFMSGQNSSGLYSTELAQDMWNYTTQFLGDVPIYQQLQPTVNNDSDYYCVSPSARAPSQAAMGQAYYNLISYTLFNSGFNGDIQAVGFNRWSWQDFGSLSQGMTDLYDNAYDGKEDQAGFETHPCNPVYTSLVQCGEPAVVPAAPAFGSPLNSCGNGVDCTLNDVAGGTIAATTYFIKFTYTTSSGETVPSAEGSQLIPANKLLVVNAVMGFPPGATGLNAYVSTTSGTETLQSSLAPGGQWTEPTTGLVAGSSPPASDTSGLGNYGNYISYVRAATALWLKIQPNKALAPATAIP